MVGSQGEESVTHYMLLGPEQVKPVKCFVLAVAHIPHMFAIKHAMFIFSYVAIIACGFELGAVTIASKHLDVNFRIKELEESCEDAN